MGRPAVHMQHVALDTEVLVDSPSAAVVAVDPGTGDDTVGDGPCPATRPSDDIVTVEVASRPVWIQRSLVKVRMWSSIPRSSPRSIQGTVMVQDPRSCSSGVGSSGSSAGVMPPATRASGAPPSPPAAERRSGQRRGSAPSGASSCTCRSQPSTWQNSRFGSTSTIVHIGRAQSGGQDRHLPRVPVAAAVAADGQLEQRVILPARSALVEA